MNARQLLNRWRDRRAPAGRTLQLDLARSGPAWGGARRFAGKVVLIIGATSGIGAATAQAMAAEGAKVFFSGRRVQLGRWIEAGIRCEDGDATYLRADVREEADVQHLVRECVARYGRIDIAFNNAGIGSPRTARLHEQSLEDMQEVWRTNAAGVFLGMKYQIPQLIKQGGGLIVNTASVAGTGFGAVAPYRSSKHSVLSMTELAAAEYAADGICVRPFLPDAVDIPTVRRAAKAFGTSYDDSVTRPEELANVVMWLCAEHLASGGLVRDDLVG